MTGQEVIKKFMASLDTTNLSGVSAVDEAIRACSNFNSTQDVINHMISDCNNSSSSDEFLKNYCQIDLYNDDTGAITGYDAGGSVVKTAESIVPEEGSYDYNFSGDSFTTHGVTFELESSYSSLSEKQKLMWGALKTWWANNAIDLIETSYGSNYNFGENTIEVSFTYDSGYLGSTPYVYYTDGDCTPVGLNISLVYYGNISNQDVSGYDPISRQTYLDRVVAHELTHSAMAANIKYFYEMPNFIVEGMAELTHGIDDFRKSDIQTLAGNSSLLSQALNLYTDSDYVSGVNAPTYAGGYMFLRYLAKQASDDNSGSSQIFTEGNDTYTNTTIDTILSALGGDDLIYNKADYVSIIGGAGNDSIITYNKFTEITGSTGNDKISLAGGSSNNIIYYAAGDGNDTIFGLKSYDTLNISGAEYTTVQTGNDLLVSVVGSGNIILKDVTSANIAGTQAESTVISGYTLNAKGTAVTIHSDFSEDILDLTKYSTIKAVDATAISRDFDIVCNSNNCSIKGGKKSDVVVGDSGNDTIRGYAGNDIIFGDSGRDKIYGYSGKDYLVGDSGNDKIYGGSGRDTLIGESGNDKLYGGSGNDTLIGGEGNDTLTGGSGKDLFIYSSGKDVITDYTAGKDKIKISGSYTSAVSGKNVIFTTSAGTLKVKNGANKKITVNGVSKFYGKNTSANLSEIVSREIVGTIELYSSAKNDSLTAVVAYANNFDDMQLEK